MPQLHETHLGQSFFAQVATFLRETMPALVTELRSLNANLREFNEHAKKCEETHKNNDIA